MKKVYILSFDAKERAGQKRGFLIDDHFAITADGDAVYLAEVVPTEWPDVFRAKARFNFVQVSRGGKSTAYLKHVITRLNSTSAYELLTEHITDISQGMFDLMKSKAK
ncbi:hypothetical protein [Paenibacillus sp. NPDC057934]|uniref:hypothetical protein n=1 Tax=Paenibacillus sp. NPDC057934 TaxID=3346282 RepID=UPI0036DD2A3A